MRAIVVGFGSIGERHARLLRAEGGEVGVVSRREVEWSPRHAAVGDAVEAHRPDYAVVANRTSEHLGTLEELAAAGFDGTVLVEKPIFEDLHPVPANRFERLLVAYNLRFHPGVRRLRELLADERVLSVHAYAGQYLPSWRPGRDYRRTCSADRAAGGGVLRDLSHELDYLNWMLGGWTRVTGVGGRVSSLEIDSEDAMSVAAEFRACPSVSLQLNYLDRRGRRFVIANTDDHTVALDFGLGTLQVDGREESVESERDDTYRSMHREILAGGRGTACDASEALDVVAMIRAVEEGADRAEWVAR